MNIILVVPKLFWVHQYYFAEGMLNVGNVEFMWEKMGTHLADNMVLVDILDYYIKTNHHLVLNKKAKQNH